MASINSRLQTIASDLFIKYGSSEREYIEGKISNLKRAHFKVSLQVAFIPDPKGNLSSK
jgi:hypothetical protein